MSQFSLKAAKAKLTEKQNLVEEAKEKLRKAKDLVFRAEQEVTSAEQDFKAAKMEFDQYQSQDKVSKRPQETTRDLRKDHRSQETNEPKGPNVLNINKDSEEPKILEIQRTTKMKESGRNYFIKEKSETGQEQFLIPKSVVLYSQKPKKEINIEEIFMRFPHV